MAKAKPMTLKEAPEGYLEAARRRFALAADQDGPHAAGLDGRCHLWTGGINTAGYGQFYLCGRNLGAHRASLLLQGQALRAGKVVRHLCHNKRCVNPAHLVEGTYLENARDRAELRRLEMAQLPPTKDELEACDEFWDLVLGADLPAPKTNSKGKRITQQGEQG